MSLLIGVLLLAYLAYRLERALRRTGSLEVSPELAQLDAMRLAEAREIEVCRGLLRGRFTRAEYERAMDSLAHEPDLPRRRSGVSVDDESLIDGGRRSEEDERSE